MNKTATHNITIEDPRELWIKLILFIIYPFGAFLLSLKNAASKSSYLIYILFGLVFCWHMNPTSHTHTNDLYWIMERVIANDFSTKEIWKQFVVFITFAEDAPKEVYENLINWFSKLFSPNPHLFFTIAAIPYLYFMLKSLKKITTDQKFTQCWYCLIVLVLFVLPRDIITVQNPRFTTGVWMAVFATISFFSSYKYQWRYFLLILATPLIHSGFWFYVLAFAGGLFTMRYQKLLIVLLYASVPFSYLSYDLLSNLNFSALPLPSTLAVWIEGYLSEDSFDKFVANEGASGFFWVSQLFSTIRTTAYLIIPLYLWKYRKEIEQRNDIKHLFRFFLYFYALVNFIQFVPVLGERFYWIVRILAIYLWFKTIYPRHNTVLKILLLSCSWEIFRRYFYNGAIFTSVPLEIFYTTLPNLIADFWGVTNITLL